MIRILHAADLHLDSPFAAMPPQKAKQRRIEQREVLSRLVSVCSETVIYSCLQAIYSTQTRSIGKRRSC